MHRAQLVIVFAGLGSAALVGPAQAEVARAPSAGSAATFAPAPRPPPRSPPPVPLVAPEIAALGRQLAGSWQCKGVSMRGDGSSASLAASVTGKLDLDNAWIVLSLVETKGPLKWTEYRTYDQTSKQWTRIQLISTSGHVVATSTGEAGGKWSWTGAAMSPDGTVQVRDFEQHAGGQLKLWGEALLGGSWQKAYEVTCKR